VHLGLENLVFVVETRKLLADLFGAQTKDRLPNTKAKTYDRSIDRFIHLFVLLLSFRFTFFSGGALLSEDGTTLIGITSFVFSPCGTNIDGFTRVSSYTDFIQNGICGLSNNPPADCELPSDWPQESPWIGPCGRLDCGTLFFGPGTRMNRDISVLGLFEFCWNGCIWRPGGERARRGPWECGTCADRENREN